jgi:hypothetical protein
MKKMKLFAFLFAITLVFSGCSKELEDMIVGKWNIDVMDVSVTMAGQTQTSKELNVGTIEFKKDGTGSSVIGTDPAESFTWTAAEETITIDKTETYTVTTKEKKKMVLEQTATEDGVTYKIVITLSLL